MFLRHFFLIIIITPIVVAVFLVFSRESTRYNSAAHDFVHNTYINCKLLMVVQPQQQRSVKAL